ncbi:AAA family ATPase [Paraconexibacter algicola]|uniref:HTH luxR-type domain-containing protein n=1 Tax=Paraconexibacter algicola TaxID=2133960 RepID=A0A2T4UHI1_9ACTN|nr:helix-turn-helix transcriptional regulator [Paraconexibacter algicola]PTL58678.1 hypothetical protein C7Y72_02935 [Paraconexibacter algicola]
MTVGTRPFVGRDDDIERLASRLRDARPAGLLLTGEAGVGKSRLAVAAARRADPDAVELHAGPGLRQIPLGALAPLLAALDIRADSASAALTALHARAAARPGLVVVVDDVPALDPASTAAVQQLALGGAVRLVLTARDGMSLPPEIERLVEDGRLEPHPVRPLTLAEAGELVAAVLGGPVDPSAARTLHEESGGNPLFLHELVAGAQQAGGLTRGPGGWALRSLVPSRRLLELVVARFAGLDRGARTFLELVAAGQPLPFDPRGADARTASALQQAGLVLLEPAGDGVEIRLAHPLYDEALRATTPTDRWATAARRAAGMLLAREDEDARLRAVALLLDVGETPEPAAAIGAAERAFALLDHPLAARIAQAVLAVEPGSFRAARVRAGALSALEDPGAIAALEHASALAGDDEERALAAQRHGLHLALRAGDPAGAIAVARAALDRIVDADWAAFVEADLAKWRMMRGEQVEDLAPEDGAGGPAQLNAHLLTALVSAMGARSADCERAVRAGLPLAAEHGELLPNARDLLQLAQFLALVAGGRLDEARAHVGRQVARVAERHDEPLGLWSYATAVLDLHVGRAGVAATGALEASRALEWRDFVGLRPVARAVRATALAQLGRATAAREVLDTIGPDELADPKAALQHAQARAWLLVHDGDRAGAVRLLAAAGADGLAAEQVLLGALTSYEAVRLGGADAVAVDLEAAARRADPGLLTLFAAHASALRRRDAEALSTVVGALADTGIPLAAADAAVQLAELQGTQRRAEDARRALLRATALRAGLDGAAGAADRPRLLTRREHEIALRAARRERSREIADALGVSTRTVDNHLASVYRKLDLTDRGQLAQALAALDGEPAG